MFRIKNDILMKLTKKMGSYKEIYDQCIKEYGCKSDKDCPFSTTCNNTATMSSTVMKCLDGDDASKVPCMSRIKYIPETCCDKTKLIGHKDPTDPPDKCNCRGKQIQITPLHHSLNGFTGAGSGDHYRILTDVETSNKLSLHN